MRASAAISLARGGLLDSYSRRPALPLIPLPQPKPLPLSLPFASRSWDEGVAGMKIGEVARVSVGWMEGRKGVSRGPASSSTNNLHCLCTSHITISTRPSHRNPFPTAPSQLLCTPDYAYGPDGFPAWGIMPNSELLFEIEVISAK